MSFGRVVRRSRPSTSARALPQVPVSNAQMSAPVRRLKIALLSILGLVSALGCQCIADDSEVAAAAIIEDAIPPGTIPRPDHVVLVVEENRPYSHIIGNPAAPYINRLAAQGALFTQAYGVTYPSQPNYLALFSGSTQGVRDNACPLHFSGPNLANALINAGFSFVTYAEDLPSSGYQGCEHDAYVRKHNPAINWVDGSLSGSVVQPMSEFPADFARLPTVALVIPNLRHDMHDGSIAEADRWLQTHVGRYEAWARTHHSLLILTWDEDDRRHGNHIVTIVVGENVVPGRYHRAINHYTILRTLGAMYDLPSLGESAREQPITEIWRRAGASGKSKGG